MDFEDWMTFGSWVVIILIPILALVFGGFVWVSIILLLYLFIFIHQSQKSIKEEEDN